MRKLTDDEVSGLGLETSSPRKLDDSEAKSLGLIPTRPKPKTNLEQPLLKASHEYGVMNTPAAALALIKNVVVDFPAQSGAFIGGAALDASEGFSKGSWSLNQARNSYHKAGEILHVGGDWMEGGEQMLSDVFQPLESAATWVGEGITDLTGSPTAGATAYAATQVLPFIFAGGAVRSRVLKRQKAINDVRVLSEKIKAKEVTQEQIKNRQAVLEDEADIQRVVDVFGPEESPKADAFALKSDIIGLVKDGIKDPSPQGKKNLQTLVEANKSIGKVSAAEIPDGSILELAKGILGSERGSVPVGGKKKGGQPDSFKDWAFGKGIGTVTIGSPDHIKLLEQYGAYRDKAGSPLQTTIEQIDKLKAGYEAGQRVEIQTSPAGKPVFTATNNIKEHQKDLAATADKVKAEAIADTKNLKKGEKVDKEAIKAKRDEAIQDKEHYADTEDILDTKPQEQAAEALAEVKAKSGKAISLGDINKVGKTKELKIEAVQRADGTMIAKITDKFGTPFEFSLAKGGATLEQVHDFVKNYTKSFGQSMAKSREIKTDIVDNAKELVDTKAQVAEKAVQTKAATEPVKTVIKEKVVDETGMEKTVTASAKEPVKRTRRKKPVTEEETERLTPVSEKQVPQPIMTEEDSLSSMMLSGKDFPSKPATESKKLGTIKGEVVAPKTGDAGLGISSWIAPFKPIAQSIQERTGFPMYKYYELTQAGLEKEGLSLRAYEKRIRTAAKGMNNESAMRIYAMLERKAFREANGDYGKLMKSVNSDADLKQLLGDTTRKEFDAAKQIRGIFNDAGTEFNIPLEKMILDYAPRMLPEGVSGWQDAIQKWKLPEEYRWAAEQERNGYLRPHERNIFKVAQSYVQRGARKRYVGQYIEELGKEINEGKLTSQADRDQVTRYLNDMRGTPTSIEETVRKSGQRVGTFMNDWINKSLETMGLDASERHPNVTYEKRVGKEGNVYFVETGSAPGLFDVHNFAHNFINMHLKLSYAGGLAIRPLVFVRSAYQSLLAAPITGPTWFMKGSQKAMTREGWYEARAAGALLDEAPVAGGELNRGWSIIDDVTQKSTLNLTVGHNFGRVIAYHAMKEKAAFFGDRYINRVMHGADITEAAQKFVKETGADFFHPELIKQEIIPLLEAGDMTSLAERMGLQMTRETQWLYRKANAPYWARSSVGRVFGQFGVWPSWYLQYARNLASRGSGMTRAKRVAGLAAVNAGFYELGKEVFGVDISSWMLTHPLMWFPLPAATIHSMQAMVGSKSDYEKQKAEEQLKNSVGIHLPGYIAAKDIINGMDEARDEDKVKRFMGFRPVED
jgi:hypothetical protein